MENSLTLKKVFDWFILPVLTCGVKTLNSDEENHKQNPTDTLNRKIHG